MSADLVAEIESLGRVYHRLVETPQGAPFYNVITPLLPRLLSRIGQNHRRIHETERECQISLDVSNTGSKVVSLKELLDNIHSKYLDMLTHIMKRVRPDEACRIPCEGIVDLLVDSKSKTFSFTNDPNPPNCIDDNHGSFHFF